VTSTISRDFWKSRHDEIAVVSMKFESGATAEMCCSVLFESPYRVEIYGTDGYAICDGTLGPRGGGTITVKDEQMEFPVANPYVGEIEDFAAAVKEERPPEVEGTEGVRNVELLVEAAGQ
ncbi:MAG: Gfo/Idh/MocA family oxidoreductase, partial [Pseudomonadota bacterium]